MCRLISSFLFLFRPDQNSLTAQRARDGEAKLRQEVCDLCNVIFEMGEKPSSSEDGGGEEDSQGKARIKFGKLFQVRKTTAAENNRLTKHAL